MMIKALVLCVMMMIVYHLASGAYYLIKDGGRSNRTVKSLTWRIILSFSLFVLLFVAFYNGYVQFHTL